MPDERERERKRKRGEEGKGKGKGEEEEGEEKKRKRKEMAGESVGPEPNKQLVQREWKGWPGSRSWGHGKNFGIYSSCDEKPLKD